jgi:hypothetical protein
MKQAISALLVFCLILFPLYQLSNATGLISNNTPALAIDIANQLRKNDWLFSE